MYALYNYAYVAEDGVTYYVAEDNTTVYVQESYTTPPQIINGWYADQAGMHYSYRPSDG